MMYTPGSIPTENLHLHLHTNDTEKELNVFLYPLHANENVCTPLEFILFYFCLATHQMHNNHGTLE